MSVSNQEDPASDIHFLSAKAAEKVKERERAEIDQRRKSLFRAWDELDIARQSGRRLDFKDPSANKKSSHQRVKATFVLKQWKKCAKPNKAGGLL